MLFPDAAWAPWQVTACSGDCTKSSGGASTKVRLCNNPSTGANNGASTCPAGSGTTTATINGVLAEWASLGSCVVTVVGCSVGEFESTP